MENKPDNDRGLYAKFRVTRIGDVEDKHLNCQYFVLDLHHDKFAAVALQAYATACAKEYPALARDLRSWVGDKLREQW